MAVTSIDVAKQAGVSQPTVSRALRDDPQVSEQTRARIRRIADEMGYVPSERGRSLSTATTGRVAMVVDLDNPLWPLLVQTIHDELMRRGLRLTLVAGHGDHVSMTDQLLGGGVDGVIMSTVTTSSEMPHTLMQRDVPLVLLLRSLEGLEVDASVANDHDGARQAADVLVEAGHRHVGAIFGPGDTSTGRGREAGFRAGLADAGVELPDGWVHTGPYTHEHGREALLTLVGEDAPTAIFCANDVIALGAYDAAHGAGLRVPDDVALVGFDDLDEAAWSCFDLTTIGVPFGDMVHSAVAMLAERIDGDAGPGRTVVHDVTVVRRSSHRLGDQAT